MTTERLSALDMAFLCLEDAAAPMHMGAVAVFDPPPSDDVEPVVALLRDRARRVLRLRQRVRESWLPPGSGVWAEDPLFDVDNHIHVHHLPWAGRDDLAALTSDLMAEPLDLSRPLWELHVITGLAGGHFALLAKLHHALCDGSGAIGLGMGLLDGAVAPSPEEATAPSLDGAVAAEPVAAGQATNALTTALNVAGTAYDLFTRPGHVLGAAIQTASQVVSQAGTALRIASALVDNLRVPTPSPLLAAPSGTKRVMLAQLDLRDLRSIRRRYGGTTNDVLLAVVTGALRQWLAAHGHPVDGLGLRALVPASQRRRSSRATGGNQLSGYLCDLPVGEPDPAARLQMIRSTMDSAKSAGPQQGPGALPVLAELLPNAAHRVATPLARHVAPLLFDIIITNVPLPSVPLHLHGAQLQEMYPLAPLASGHALAIALSQYRDTVGVGLHANSDALPDIEKLSEALTSAVTDLIEGRVSTATVVG